MKGLLRALCRRAPELILVLVGIALRWSMLRNYQDGWGYDYGSHWMYIEWFRTHWHLPDPLLCRESFAPPLYFFVAGKLRALDWLDPLALRTVSVACGSLRLVLIWIGLEWFLPTARGARCLALALAAVVPASVHLDGMATNEGMNGLWAAAVIVLAPTVFRAQGWQRARRAAALGLFLGLGLLTKATALSLLVAVCAAIALEAWWTAPGARARRLAPWAAAALTLLMVSGWYFAHNQQRYGKLMLGPYDGKEKVLVPRQFDMPYYLRRPVDYFVGWTDDIYSSPYSPSASLPRSRFFPTLLASTFADYYNYWYAGAPRPTAQLRIAYAKPIDVRAFALSRWSVAGGTVIALVTVLAWLAAARALWRRREVDQLVLLLMPLVMLGAQAHFAILLPVDDEGVVKGTYLQLAAPPLCALFGVAVVWLWRRARILAFVPLASLAAVATFTIACRFILPAR